MYGIAPVLEPYAVYSPRIECIQSSHNLLFVVPIVSLFTSLGELLLQVVPLFKPLYGVLGATTEFCNLPCCEVVIFLSCISIVHRRG